MIKFDTEKLYSFKGKEHKTEVRELSCRMTTSQFVASDESIDTVKVNDNLLSAYQVLSQGDDKPYLFLSEMKFGEDHKVYDDTIFTEDWAKSFVAKLDIAPFPLSIFGHVSLKNPQERAKNNGYVVGGIVKGDSLLLLNYLSKGETEEEVALKNQTIKEIKAKMLSTSISNLTRVILMQNEETDEYQWYAIESLSGQRNDIVEHDLTGGDAQIISSSLKSKTADKSVTKNLGENMEKQITLKDMLTKLQTLKSNGDLSVEEIAKAFNLKIQTGDDVQNAVILKSLKEELGEVNILETVKTLKSENNVKIDSEFEKNKEVSISEKFENKDLKEMATEMFTLKTGTLEECKKEVERVSALKSMTMASSAIAGGLTPNILLSSSDQQSSNGIFPNEL